MESKVNRDEIRRRVRHRIRRRLQGTAEKPRLAIFRSDKHIYAQAVDDAAGRTLAHASSRDAVPAREPQGRRQRRRRQGGGHGHRREAEGGRAAVRSSSTAAATCTTDG
jgi:hypothetical protein